MGPGGRGVRFGDSTGRREDVSEIEQGVGVLAEQVALRGEFCRRARDFLRFAMVATVGDNPWLTAWVDRSSPAAASWLIAIKRVASSYRLGPWAAIALASLAAVPAR